MPVERLKLRKLGLFGVFDDVWAPVTDTTLRTNGALGTEEDLMTVLDGGWGGGGGGVAGRLRGEGWMLTGRGGLLVGAGV